MKTMQALQWDGKELLLNTVPLPTPESGEVLVRLTKAGICNTDLEILRGYYPFQGTLGHEFVGVVEQAEDDTLIGKRIVSDINNSCHQCDMCNRGNPHHCLNRSALGIKDRDGAFAEFLTTPASNLVMIPDHVPDDMAVFAEPLAAALEIQEQIDFSVRDEIAVIGDGKLGLLITLSLIQAGYDVTLLGHHPERAAQLGISNLKFNSSVPDKKFSVVIEATGSPSGFSDAMKIIAPLGTLVLKSTYQAPLEFNPGPLVVNEITLVGSRCGPMDKAVARMASGEIDPTGLIEAVYPLKESLSAVDQANANGTLKILITMS
jgi:threonine dehydrogenase-like Zn-dependent dehydrogenase